MEPAVSEFGEEELIKFVLEVLDEGFLPKNEDCAGFLLNGKVIGFCTDSFVNKTDFPPRANYWFAGWKTVTMCVSDAVSKALEPCAFIASVNIPKSLPYVDFKRIIYGMKSACRYYGVKYLGGDIGESDNVVLAGAVVAVGEKEDVVLRSGAKPGDYLAVTGPFGDARIGLELLLGKVKATKESALDRKLILKFLKPIARVEEGLKLSKRTGVTSRIDSSDGLAASLWLLADLSGVGFVIDKLPASPELLEFCERNGLDAKEFVFYGGEEYELVFTVSPDRWHEVEEIAKKHSLNVLRIGRSTAEKGILFIDASGGEYKVQRRGWTHLRCER